MRAHGKIQEPKKGVAAMPLVVQSVTDVLVDTSSKLSLQQAKNLYAAGVRSVWRYVFFGPPRPGDLDLIELQNLTSSGLTVCVVQHVRNPGWVASDAQGEADGKVAVANAVKAGYMPVTGSPAPALALDMEGLRNPGPYAVDHARAWIAEVMRGGYDPVVYVGYDSGLNAAYLDGCPAKLWCDYAPLSLRPAPKKGYVLHQQPQSVIAGVGVDKDTILQSDMIFGVAAAAPVQTGCAA